MTSREQGGRSWGGGAEQGCRSAKLPVPVAHFLYRACHILRHQAISHKMVAQRLKGAGAAVLAVGGGLSPSGMAVVVIAPRRIEGVAVEGCAACYSTSQGSSPSCAL